MKPIEIIEDSSPPAGTAGPAGTLAPEERLLVEAMRLAQLGESPRTLFCLALGEVAGVTAAHGLEGFLRLLAGAARRPVRLPGPGAAGISVPERLLLDLVAAMQADHAALSAGLLAWLFPLANVRAAAMHARLLASALASVERRLPVRAPAPPPMGGGERRRTPLALVV